MKLFACGLVTVLVTLGALGVLGCSNENEAEIRAQEAKSSESEVKDPVKPVRSQADMAKTYVNPFAKDKGYPNKR
jgi:hypothetical protein